MDDRELCEMARQARSRAYAPYSGYTVGAALLCASGRVYTGCNIENAAFSPSVCAERVAVFKAVSEGDKDFLKIAVCGGRSGQAPAESFPPCGVCRQVLAEFCKKDFVILLAGPDSFEKMSLEQLLPLGFSPEDVDGAKGKTE